VQEKAAGRLDPILVSLGVLLLYLSFPSSLHLFDGVACAIAVELGDFKHLVHGNHLLYGLAGYLFHRLLLIAGIKLSALWALQVFDSVLGAAAAGLFCSVLRRSGAGRFASLLCSLGLGVSHAYWKWSVEANAYVLGAFFLLLCLREALSPRPGPYRLALWHSLAMLSVGANALFAPVALLALWRAPAAGRDPRMESAKYLVAAGAAVLAGYVAAAVLWVQPETVEEAKLWLLGSGALGPHRTWRWHGRDTVAQNLLDWIAASGGAVCKASWLGAPLWLAALAAPWLADLSDWPLLASGWLWLLSYAPLFMFWEPYTLIYRVSDMPALWLAAAPLAARLGRRPWWKALLAAYAAAVLAVNLRSAFLPDSRPENNSALQEALWVASVTPPTAWIAAAGDDQVYLPYFAHRRPLILFRYQGREAALVDRVRELQSSGEPVFVTGATLDLGWGGVFTRIGVSAASASGKTVLYRVSDL